MPRNASGNFSLPLPPVVPGTVIESVFENTTDDDIAQALTDSLDRYGRGGMVAPFRIVDGTVSAPALAFAAETGTGLYRPSAGVMGLSVLGVAKQTWSSAGSQVNGGLAVTGDFSTVGQVNVGSINGTPDLILKSSGTEKMRIDAVGNVAVGVQAAAVRMHIGGSGSIRYRAQSLDVGGAIVEMAADGAKGVVGTNTHNDLTLYTNTQERMRFGADGLVLVGVDVPFGLAQFNLSGNGQYPLSLRNANTSAGLYWNVGPATSNNGFVVYNQNTLGVYVLDGGTTWGSTSDERLKTDLVPISDALDKVAALRAVTGRFKRDEPGTSRAFLIAQDVLAVLPEAVSEAPGTDGMLGLCYTDVIPLLVAAIKELNLRLAALEG